MHSESFLKHCYKKLDKGLDKFNLDLGIVSHIENEIYHLVAVRDSSNTFTAGEYFSIGDTYCREVWNKGASVSIPMENDERKIQDHPLHPNLPLQAYISAPILYDSKIWGTINFSSLKSNPLFKYDDIQYLERLAADITAALFEENLI
jgi:two-component system, sensor histidine kinase